MALSMDVEHCRNRSTARLPSVSFSPAQMSEPLQERPWEPIINRLICCSNDTTIDENQSKSRLKTASARKRRARERQRSSSSRISKNNSAFSRIPLLSRLESVEILTMHVPCGRNSSSAEVESHVGVLADEASAMLLNNDLFLYVSRDSKESFA
mmetsp:Transcript_15278/g.30859  ORF Transcript_15278/g.30859 Transcript_15278/m.30859 type:complete len:154 (+) Transcript_15278:311-772(+)